MLTLFVLMVYINSMLRINKIKKYKFDVESQSVSSVAGHQIPIKPIACKKVVGFFYSFLLPVFDDGLFWPVNLGYQNKTRFKSQLPFNCILSFQGKNLDDIKLYWKRYCSGLAKPSQNGRAVDQVYRQQLA